MPTASASVAFNFHGQSSCRQMTRQGTACGLPAGTEVDLSFALLASVEGIRPAPSRSGWSSATAGRFLAADPAAHRDQGAGLAAPGDHAAIQPTAATPGCARAARRGASVIPGGGGIARVIASGRDHPAQLAFVDAEHLGGGGGGEAGDGHHVRRLTSRVTVPVEGSGLRPRGQPLVNRLPPGQEDGVVERVHPGPGAGVVDLHQLRPVVARPVQTVTPIPSPPRCCAIFRRCAPAVSTGQPA